jgi:hypothetical protein
LSLDQRAKILEAVTSNSYGIKETIQKVQGTRASNIISLVKDMTQERLVQVQQVPRSRPGRPKKKIIPTSLGYEFLETYRTLKAKPLRSRQSDLEHAKRDAAYAESLVKNGHSPFQLFMELNTIANNIKISGETS